MTKHTLAAFLIPGAPRTKKNHTQTVWRRDKATGKNRRYQVGSDAFKLWEDRSLVFLTQVCAQSRAQGFALPIGGHLEVRARVYRERNDAGDLVGYLQALGDVLQKGRVIRNDRLIASWDGSRLYVDKDHPRVEVTIYAFAEATS